MLIQHQILITKCQGNLYQLEGRIINQILGFKGYLENGRHREKFI